MGFECHWSNQLQERPEKPAPCRTASLNTNVPELPEGSSRSCTEHLAPGPALAPRQVLSAFLTSFSGLFRFGLKRDCSGFRVIKLRA